MLFLNQPLEVSEAEKMAGAEEVAVFQVCSKCGGDIDGELEDKDGRPICQDCLEAKNRSGVGWFKSLIGSMYLYLKHFRY